MALAVKVERLQRREDERRMLTHLAMTAPSGSAPVVCRDLRSSAAGPGLTNLS